MKLTPKQKVTVKLATNITLLIVCIIAAFICGRKGNWGIGAIGWIYFSLTSIARVLELTEVEEVDVIPNQ